MKTGGTLNFLKRAGAMFLLIAVFASSCNKYADDFKQLNTKLDALAAQVAGVTQLSTDMTALKAQVTAIQTAVAALPNPTASIATLTTNLATVSGNVDKINTALTALAATAASKTDVTAAVATVTANVKAELTLQLAAVNKAIADAQAAMKADNSAQTTAVQQAIVANNTALAATIQAQLDALQSSLLTSNQATVAAVNAMKVLLDAQKIQLDQILANTAMLNGSVTITSDSEVDFYMAKISQMGIINGDASPSLTVNTTNITDAKMANLRTIISKITAVIGTGDVNITFKAGDNLSFAALTSVKGNLGVTGTVTATTRAAAADINFPLLSSVYGTGNVTLNYDGGYTFAALKSVAGTLSMTDYATDATTTPATLGVTTVSFPVADVKTGVNTGTAGTVTFASATAVELSGDLTTLTANKAATLKLNQKVYSGAVTITDSKGGATVNLAACTNVGGALAITVAKDASLNLDNLENLDATSTPVAQNVTISTLEGTVSLPKYHVGVLTCNKAKTVTAPVFEWTAGTTLGSVETLTVGALNNAMTVPGTAKTVKITGKDKGTSNAYATCAAAVTATGSNTLVSLTLSGYIKSASVTSTGLTSLTTTGVVNELTVSGCTNSSLTSLNLGHTHYPSGPGSSLVINGNTKLTSLKTSTNYPLVLQITGNSALASVDLTSYANAISTPAPVKATITIDAANALNGVYTASKPSLGSDPFVEAKIAAAFLQPIKALVAKATDTVANGGFGFTDANFTLNIDLKDADPVTTGDQNLSTLMIANAGAYNAVTNPTVVDATGGVTTVAELKLVQ